MQKRELDKKRRRQAIIKTARYYFTKEGYEAASMSAIQKSLGGSKSTLWTYFKSKEDLFFAVVEEIFFEFELKVNKIDLNEDSDNSIAKFCEIFSEIMFDHEALRLWSMLISAIYRFPHEIEIIYERIVGIFQSNLANLTNYKILRGELRCENAAEMANMLIGLCLGTALTISRKNSEYYDSHFNIKTRRHAEYLIRCFVR